MNRLKKSLSVLVLAGVGATGFMFGNGLIRDVQFARAEAQVQTSREQLAKAEDLASVFRNVGKAVEPSVVNIYSLKAVHTRLHPICELPRYRDLGDCLLELVLAHRVGGAFGLLSEVQPRQLQRLHFPGLFRVDVRLIAGTPTLVGLELLHSLGDSRLRVYQSFS